MGWAARANPCSVYGASERSAKVERMRRFVGGFSSRQAWDQFLHENPLIDVSEIAFLESLLPDRLKAN